MWPAPEALQKNCNWCLANKLGCLIGSIHVVKWERAKDVGAKGMKVLKKAQVEGLEVEAKSGSGDSEAEGLNMGVWVTQDLLVALLGIRKEMAKHSEIMWQMLQVSMVQLEVMRVRGIDLPRWKLCARSGVVCQGQVEVHKGAGDGVKGPYLRGIGEVPRSESQWGKAGVGPSQGSDGNALR